MIARNGANAVLATVAAAETGFVTVLAHLAWTRPDAAGPWIGLGIGALALAAAVTSFQRVQRHEHP